MTFQERRDAEDAEKEHGNELQGREIRVNFARDRPPIEESRKRAEEQRQEWAGRGGGGGGGGGGYGGGGKLCCLGNADRCCIWTRG